jgi:hypothetical protein
MAQSSKTKQTCHKKPIQYREVVPLSCGFSLQDSFSTTTFAFEHVHCDSARARTFQDKELIFFGGHLPNFYECRNFG